jgi:hypothetical protein
MVDPPGQLLWEIKLAHVEGGGGGPAVPEQVILKDPPDERQHQPDIDSIIVPAGNVLVYHG